LAESACAWLDARPICCEPLYLFEHIDSMAPVANLRTFPRCDSCPIENGYEMETYTSTVHSPSTILFRNLSAFLSERRTEESCFILLTTLSFCADPNKKQETGMFSTTKTAKEHSGLIRSKHSFFLSEETSTSRCKSSA
jgi:hypothetical protein